MLSRRRVVRIDDSFSKFSEYYSFPGVIILFDLSQSDLSLSVYVVVIREITDLLTTLV